MYSCILYFPPRIPWLRSHWVLTCHGLQRGGGVPVLPRRPRALRPLLVGGRGQVPPPDQSEVSTEVTWPALRQSQLTWAARRGPCWRGAGGRAAPPRGDCQTGPWRRGSRWRTSCQLQQTFVTWQPIAHTMFLACILILHNCYWLYWQLALTRNVKTCRTNY